MKVVSNSTPLIALARINEVNLLHALFGRIIIPQGVYNEVVLQGTELPGVKEIREATWIETLQVLGIDGVAPCRGWLSAAIHNPRVGD